ncbi:hypothetical protein MLD38_019937 [Melastoma candidum]|uniref:Uncharacterized protein n=1 Tax=Melastoma candidum TaxID=119954 RepID=A0ACB9QD95_9MYRT|nr:hypothetical protein MLD38_019937 [Melastoma candidum]
MRARKKIYLRQRAIRYTAPFQPHVKVQQEIVNLFQLWLIRPAIYGFHYCIVFGRQSLHQIPQPKVEDSRWRRRFIPISQSLPHFAGAFAADNLTQRFSRLKQYLGNGSIDRAVDELQEGDEGEGKWRLLGKEYQLPRPRCRLVLSPDPQRPCKEENPSCPYFYWYGDHSNTTGDFAFETFTVNLTSSNGVSEYPRDENVMFDCGHWNRGLFQGAAGLLGLGRGPLSFSSQLQSIYGHSFSYCLVDHNSDSSVSSKLIFGEDKDFLSHPSINFTSFVPVKETPIDTFYYVQVKSILVGGEQLDIPKETWKFGSDGSGGTIIDSGATLSYFVEPPTRS